MAAQEDHNVIFVSLLELCKRLLYFMCCSVDGTVVESPRPGLSVKHYFSANKRNCFFLIFFAEKVLLVPKYCVGKTLVRILLVPSNFC